MASLKSLAKETAIYGMSSILGRFLNYLLVPLYTAKLSAASGGYGVITNVYAYVALLLVILTYGMETTFFRFSNKEGEDPQRVYSTILAMVGTTSLLFVALVLTFISPISSFMGYGDHPSYIWVMALTVAIDAFQCIPTVGAGYAFYINLACTGSITFCFWKELTGFRPVFDRQLMKRMLSYSWPILVLGIAGILNQTADKILFPYIYRGNDAHTQLGIYGAASKIAMIMAMITQAFRYAYEPFVFGKAKDKDNRDTYAKAMKYFIVFTLLAFLLVVGYMDILRHIIGRDYWSGLRVVPIVMAAEIMMGVYFNLSFWYKLIDKTIWGAWFSGIGCAVLITVNLIFVPRYGYMACAWAGFAGYGTAMVISYLVGQKHYPIAYPLKDIVVYTLLAAAIFAAMTWANANMGMGALAANTVLVVLFAAYIVKHEGLAKRLRK